MHAVGFDRNHPRSHPKALQDRALPTNAAGLVEAHPLVEGGNMIGKVVVANH